MTTATHSPAAESAARAGSTAPTLDPSQVILDDPALAERWGVSVQTLRIRRMKNDVPKFFRIGRFVRYRLSDVIAYENEHMN